jgi:hypothetical protein
LSILAGQYGNCVVLTSGSSSFNASEAFVPTQLFTVYLPALTAMLLGPGAAGALPGPVGAAPGAAGGGGRGGSGGAILLAAVAAGTGGGGGGG